MLVPERRAICMPEQAFAVKLMKRFTWQEGVSNCEKLSISSGN